MPTAATESTSCDINDSLSENLFTCPACHSRQTIDTLSALYGLHLEDGDDAILFGLCKDCAPLVNEPKTHLRRVRLKDRLEAHIVNHETEVLSQFAVTTLKILEVHGGDHIQALMLGWPLPKPIHHYDVACMPGGMVVVCEKESGNE